MSKKRKNNKSVTPDRAWSSADRRAFADRNILRAQTIPSLRQDGPQADEWDDDEWDEWL